MNIPGIEREEDGTIVIVISETMRLIILTAVVLLVVIAIWWVAIYKADSEKRKISRIPGNIPLVEDFAEDDLPILTEPERILGVDGPQSNLNLERLSRADREELEKIFDGILSEGVPNLKSEAAQLYDSLIYRSAEIAPNRALQFYDLFEAPSHRLYSIAQLYKKWMDIDAVKAVEVAGAKIEEPLLYHILQRDLPALAETKPEQALAAAIATRGDYFRVVDADYIRPVMRAWGKRSFSAAQKAASKLERGKGRLEAFQGLAMAKLDTSTNWAAANNWAKGLGNQQDRLWAQLTITELGIHKKLKVGRAVNSFPNQTLKQHLLRLQEAHRIANAYPESDRSKQTLHFYRSHEPYEYHGRLCILNTFPGHNARKDAAFRLHWRWPELREKTFVSDGFLLYHGVPPNVPQAPLVNLLDRGTKALASGDLNRASADLTTYLHYNPGFPEIEGPLTELSKANGTWLGQGASKLDEVLLPPISFSKDTLFRDAILQLQQLFKEASGQDMQFYAFEGISGRSFGEIRLYGNTKKVSAREALDTLMDSNGLAYDLKEYGLLSYYLRDEDVAPLMGRPIELIPYPVF